MSEFKAIRRKLCAILSGLAVLIVVAPVQAALITYSGSLTSTSGGLTGLLVPGSNNDWLDTPGTTISWTVSRDDATANPWTYSYSLTVPHRDISHFIIEASSGSNPFTSANIVGPVSYNYTAGSGTGSTVIQTHNATNPPNGAQPGMPENVYGIKFEGYKLANGTSINVKYVNVTFQSYRNPVWGDFYAKDGSGVAIWNAGFTDPNGINNVLDDVDPITPPSSGSVSNHLLVPDTTNVVVPEPSLLGLAALGLMSLRRPSRQ